MIFITIGTVFPFDRLIKTMDDYAETTGTTCLAQIGKGDYRPRHMEWKESLGGSDFKTAVADAQLIVSHAGMGSVITAMQVGTPIVMLPRRFEAGEHTTDHQMATARWLQDKPGVFIAWDEADLAATIAEAEGWSGNGDLSMFAPRDFTDRLRGQFTEWLG